jgi:hypothetical protein
MILKLIANTRSTSLKQRVNGLLNYIQIRKIPVHKILAIISVSRLRLSRRGMKMH